MRKRKGKWKRRLTSIILAAGLCLTSNIYSVAAPQNKEINAAVLPVAEQIASIDFSKMENLNDLNGWKIYEGAGTAELVSDEEGNVLKLRRTAGGDETGLLKEALNIQESRYRYVSVEIQIKMGTEDHANQFSIPYLSDDKNAVAYTIFTDGDWTSYKSHVNGKNPLAAGTVKKGEWQTIRMDIDMKEDTFRIAVDGEYLLAGAGARTKTDNLDKIKFYADSWNTGTMYIRSAEVTAQKERTESATFYISNNGNDANTGLSENQAWQSVLRANQEHFIPGDKILFERGGLWENETFQPQGSGTKAAKIMTGSYGDGELPRIAANGKRADALYLCNQQYWEISELDISNTVKGFTMISNGEIPSGNVSERVDENGKKLGDFRGIHIAGRDVKTLKGFWIHNVKVHDVTGVVSWIGDTGLRDPGIMNNAGLDGSKRTGGVLIECLAPTGNQPTQFSDIIIEDSEFINNSFCGITVKQWNGSGNQYGENPGWANRNGSTGAPDYVDDNWYPHSNIIIQDNYVNQGASAYACNGIYLTSSRDSVIQRNVLEHIGTCGIELYFTDNVAVQYNEVSDVVKKGGGADDNAIDPDWRVTNALIQYNYVHDCGEAFLLCGVQFNTGVIRYNLAQDCKRSYVHYSMGSGYFQIYNNVFYRSADGTGTGNFDPWGGGKTAYFNNVFYDAKETGFTFSSGTSFAYDNNAYFGTMPPVKDANPIILTENPFEGTAPSLDRKGSFETGPLLEANGLKPGIASMLIAAGVVKDPNGYSIDEGLKERGSQFDFTPLAKADKEYLGNCINIDRMDYPYFENTGEDAVIGSNKTQQAADTDAPTIGIFEVPLDAENIILKGKVTDGSSGVAGIQIEAVVGEKKVSTITGSSGSYTIMEGLEAGKAVITAKREGYEDISVTVTLEKGKINVGNIVLPLLPMPDDYVYTLIDETFETGSSANFDFNSGSEITGGKLVITKDMSNATAAVSNFEADIAGQKAVDFSFDWSCDYADKMGLEFRDSYQRLLFAICTAPQKKELRVSVKGDAVDDAKAASASEPVWDPVTLDISKTYTFRIHADFEAGTVSYRVSEKDGDVLVQQLNLPTDAVNLAKMNACSWWASKPQYIDNFKLTAPAENAGLTLKGKSIYAFGDSIVAGHQYEKSSFIDFAARQEGMSLKKFAVNGATILDAGYSGGQIMKQIEKAPEEAPDYVLFDGGTNDAEYIKNQNISYDLFAEAFTETISRMRRKWPDASIIYTAVHKMGSRDNEVQEKLHELELEICEKEVVTVANVYDKAVFDTNDVNQKNQYTFDSLSGNGLPGINGSGTHPNFSAIEQFYVPITAEAFKSPEEKPDPDPEKDPVSDIFTDIMSGDWFEPYVQYVYDHEIMTGMTKTEFGPYDILARSHFATMLHRLEDSPKAGYEKRFHDVPDGQFYTAPVMWASAEDVRIITGYVNGNFGPDDSITREQMVVMLYRYADYKKFDVTDVQELTGFSDHGDVSGFAAEAMKWAVGTELIKGDDGKINPQGVTSRAVCATIMQRFMEQYADAR